MQQGMAAGTAMGGMGTTITTAMTIHMAIPTNMGMPAITAMQPHPLPPPQPRRVGAPCPSPWWPRGMYTAPTATTTTDPRRMRLDRPTPLPAASFLQLMWLASPALPVGGFSYSEGLESAIENAGLASEAAVGDWLLDQLHITQARGDMALIAKAVGAWRRGDLEHVKELNDWVLHTRETSELRLQTEQMGRSMAEWLRNQYQSDEALMPAVRHLAALPPTYPVAFALAASPTQASVREVLLAYAFGWAENMVQAALKSMQLGQSAGQRILARLAAAIPLAADHAASLMDSERQAFSPMLAILSAQHEVQYSRLFRS